MLKEKGIGQEIGEEVHMSFLDKLKQGVTDAGQKAKTVVEINRLKLQAQDLAKQVEEKQAKIGEIVFMSFSQNQTVTVTSEIEGYCHEIVEIQSEIKQLHSKIKELNNEKVCDCGKVVSLETKFCPTCGHQFSMPPEIIDISAISPPLQETKNPNDPKND
ncbi:zinc ribbon domain-containing protein [Brevibacillus reuszeri]|nr:zinc ribbon domain-containing protein [Brevibacillus reuszeri]MED1859028.1 zinc ribbon domain-containing protein [Brevibacillus reuszeri]